MDSVTPLPDGEKEYRIRRGSDARRVLLSMEHAMNDDGVRSFCVRAIGRASLVALEALRLLAEKYSVSVQVDSCKADDCDRFVSVYHVKVEQLK